MWWFPKPNLRRSKRDDTDRRSGFLTRLGNLIVLQCLFVFVALGLVLFYSNDDISDGGTDQATRSIIEEVGNRVAEQYIAGETATEIESKKFRTQLQVGSEGILSAALFVVRGNDSIECLQALGPQFLTSNESPRENVAGELSPDLIRHAAGEAPGFMLSSLYNAEQTIFYFRPNVPGNTSAVFAALVNHDLFISRRSDLQYVMLLLFLSSILLSLLTVYLIWKRFRQPLVHMIKRLEKTANGELFYQLETEGDIELSVLSGTFNKLTKTLWSNQQEMKGFNTRLREINESLLQSHLFLATLIDSSPSSIVVTARDGEIIIFNREASKTFGYPDDTALGKNVNELFKQPLDLSSTPISQEHPHFEAIGLRQDGAAFPVFVTATPVHSEEHNIWAFVYIIHDITESQSFQDMMIRLDRYSTRGEMAGDIAHEINNYLAVLSGNLELLPLILKKGDPQKIATKIELMRTTVDRITKFADGLMDTNPDDLTLEYANLNQVIENVLAFLKPQNKFDTVEFLTDLSSNLPPIKVDLGQIQQLLVNLINNAADAMPDDLPERVVHISTSLSNHEGRAFATVHVKDSGPGVPDDRVEVLFARRFTTKRKGHGIGLITCKRILDAHQGVISYHYDAGAVFSCSLPYERVAAIVPDTPTPAPQDMLVRA